MRAPAAFAALLLFSRSIAVFAAADTKPPQITHARVTKAALGKSITIRARIEDESAVFAPSVLVRPRGKKEFDSIDMKRVGEGYEATIPAEQVTADLEYVIEAFDEHGNGPAREGSPESPLLISVFDPTKVKIAPEPEGEPKPEVVPKQDDLGAKRGQDEDGVEKKWWFWAIIGAAAAGGATAIFLLTAPGNVDAVDVLVRGPDPVPES
jgi:hypothetical protein